MHQSVQIVTASTCEPLTLDEAKRWLRCEGDLYQDDALIETLITASRAKVEERTQRKFYQTSCALWLDAFPLESTGVVKLPLSPVQSVTAITAYNSTDGATVMSSSDYTVDLYSEPARVALRGLGSWPTGGRTVNQGQVAFVAGYSTSTGDGSTGLPAACAPMVSAVKLVLAHLYENRQQVIVSPGQTVALELAYGVDYLLAGLVSPEAEG